MRGFTWLQAQYLAQTHSQRVRRDGWETWRYLSAYGWLFEDPAGGTAFEKLHVVLASEFTADDGLASDWTNEHWDGGSEPLRDGDGKVIYVAIPGVARYPWGGPGNETGAGGLGSGRPGTPAIPATLRGGVTIYSPPPLGQAPALFVSGVVDDPPSPPPPGVSVFIAQFRTYPTAVHDYPPGHSPPYYLCYPSAKPVLDTVDVTVNIVEYSPGSGSVSVIVQKTDGSVTYGPAVVPVTGTGSYRVSIPNIPTTVTSPAPPSPFTAEYTVVATYTDPSSTDYVADGVPGFVGAPLCSSL